MGNRIHILGLLEHELTDEYTGVLPYTILSTLNMFEIFYSEKEKKPDEIKLFSGKNRQKPQTTKNDH